MTEKTEALDPRALEKERRRNRVLPKSGGTYERKTDGSLPVDDNGNFVPVPGSVTKPPSGKSEMRRAMYAKELRESGVEPETAFNQAMAAASVPAPRRRNAPPADENPKIED